MIEREPIEEDFHDFVSLYFIQIDAILDHLVSGAARPGYADLFAGLRTLFAVTEQRIIAAD